SPNQLAEYLGGNDRLFGYFVGQVMKASEGVANPKKVNELLKTELEKERK
ncbi:MAG: glutamyl amidotransferase, partial [Proteobacteria bacterium]